MPEHVEAGAHGAMGLWVVDSDLSEHLQMMNSGCKGGTRPGCILTRHRDPARDTHREAIVTSFLGPTPPSSSASDELMSSSALDQPPSSSGASSEWDVLLQPRKNSAL